MVEFTYLYSCSCYSPPQRESEKRGVGGQHIALVLSRKRISLWMKQNDSLNYHCELWILLFFLYTMIWNGPTYDVMCFNTSMPHVSVCPFMI